MADNVTIDPLTGMRQETVFEQGKMVVRTTQNVQPYLDYNKALRDAEDYKKRGIKKGLMHAACIPPIVVHHWLKTEGFNIFTASRKEIDAKLNHPDYAYLKTINGRV